MKEEIRIHNGYVEWEEAKDEGIKIPLLFGKYQHIFSSEKGEISMIRLIDYLFQGDNFWEIFCLKGNLFEDTERFKEKKEAIRRISELLIGDELQQLISDKVDEMNVNGKNET